MTLKTNDGLRSTKSTSAKSMSSKLMAGGLALLLTASFAAAQSSPDAGKDTLKAGFENPPSGARPRVWWHWMNGNISKEGIKMDLEWMHRVRLGGFQN